MSDLPALLKTLTAAQLDFVRVRLQVSSDAEAARTIGVAPGTVTRWKTEGAPIDAIVQLAKVDSVLLAREHLRRLATKAVQVLDAEMDDRRHRLDAAKDVLDRVGIEAGRKVDVTSKGDKLAGVPLVLDDTGGSQ